MNTLNPMLEDEAKQLNVQQSSGAAALMWKKLKGRFSLRR